MIFLLGAIAIVLSGRALLEVLGLARRAPAVDLALGWFLGSGWLGLAALVSRFLLGVPFGRSSALVLLAVPVAAWAALRRLGLLHRAEPPAAPRPRLLPRPAWLFVPIAAWVVATAGAILLHGASTPTHTDDGVRVRAFTPMLAFEDAWPPEARRLLALAGAVPTFVPALGWVLAGEVNHFHANYVVLADLLAFLALLVGLGSRSGSPERGWAAAFAVLSVPLFVYHCTSTYQDAVLAMIAGASVLFILEHGRSRDARDAGLALALAAVAALVKQEGEIVGPSVAAVVLLQAWVRRRHGEALPRGALPALAAVALLVLAAKAAAVGWRDAVPLLGTVAGRAAGAAAPAAAASGAALRDFGVSLFLSGNTGMLYWILLASLLAATPRAVSARHGWALVAVLLLFLQVAASSVWLFPQYTIDQTTVNRALLVVSIPASVWLADFLWEGVAAERGSGAAGEAAGGGEEARGSAGA